MIFEPRKKPHDAMHCWQWELDQYDICREPAKDHRCEDCGRWIKTLMEHEPGMNDETQ